MHLRWLLAAVAALALAGCSPSPTTPTAVKSPTAAPTGGARLHVTGSGVLCSQWYAGCVAYLTVVAPDWSLPDAWTPTADDTEFRGDLVAGSESVAVTGVRRAGRERIEPGSYRLVVVKTTSPDSGPSVGTITASILCSVDVVVAPGAGAVDVNVAFDSTCSIRVASTDASPAASD